MEACVITTDVTERNFLWRISGRRRWIILVRKTKSTEGLYRAAEKQGMSVDHVFVLWCSGAW